MNILLELLNKVGEFGPVILFFSSLCLLWNKEVLLFYYVIGIFINALLNIILKGIFQHPRPSEDIEKFNLAIGRGKMFIFKDGIPFNIFGMPSGHAQSALFSTVFIFLSTKNINIFILYLILSLITINQRILYNYHNLFQTIVGGIVGGFVGYMFYYYSKNNSMGKITEKKDDYGPL